MGIKRHTEKALQIICTDMEISNRKKLFPDAESVIQVKHKIACTACGKNLMNDLGKGLVCTHPSLETIICKECLQFYGDGLYVTDKKGDDIYCRWCAQGGTIYCCSKCSVAFCKKCIERNLKSDKKVMADKEKDNWCCFICVSRPLWYLRALCWAVKKYKSVIIRDIAKSAGGAKRKLSVSSTDSASKPGPASMKKSLAGPASKKLKLESPKPGPASKTKAGPASTKPGPLRSKIKVEKEEPEWEPTDRRTRGKQIDFSEKLEFPAPSPKSAPSNRGRKPAAPPAKKATPAKKSPRNAKKKKSFVDDDSSDEDFNVFEEDEDNGSEIEEEIREPLERELTEVLDFCTKLTTNFNLKLLKYRIAYQGNLTTSDKVNTACINLHVDLKKINRLFSAVDKKMMDHLDDYNAAQQALITAALEREEAARLELERIENERLEAERTEAERIENERLAAEAAIKRAEEEKAEAERIAAELAKPVTEGIDLESHNISAASPPPPVKAEAGECDDEDIQEVAQEEDNGNETIEMNDETLEDIIGTREETGTGDTASAEKPSNETSEAMDTQDTASEKPQTDANPAEIATNDTAMDVEESGAEKEPKTSDGLVETPQENKSSNQPADEGSSVADGVVATETNVENASNHGEVKTTEENTPVENKTAENNSTENAGADQDRSAEEKKDTAAQENIGEGTKEENNINKDDNVDGLSDISDKSDGLNDNPENSFKEKTVIDSAAAPSETGGGSAVAENHSNGSSNGHVTTEYIQDRNNEQYWQD